MTHLLNPRAERLGIRDFAIAGLLTALGLLLMYENAVDQEIDASYLAMPAWLAVSGPVLWRRTAPLYAPAASFCGLLLHAALFGTLVRCGAVYPLVFVFAFSMGAQLEGREAVAGFALLTALTLVSALTDELGFGVIVIAPLFALVWLVGRITRTRQRMVAELDVRTTELRAARDERARLEIATDRARLGAELDELLRRRLGQLAELADAGPAAGGSAVDQLAELELESRRALEDMREIVGVLRSEEGAVAVAAPPTLAHLEALVLRRKGDLAQVSIVGDPRVLPAGVELSAYRVIEHLLEALGDAPGVGVEVRFGDDALELAVSGPARRRGAAGAAVERARERVQLHRGTLETRVRHGRTEAIARLPVSAGA